MSDLAKQNYELAFHISPILEDADVQRTRQELEKIVTSHGGVISFSKDPEKIRLAYPIEHQSNAYFGYFSFDLDRGESLNQIRDDIRLNPDILRFLILKQRVETKSSKEDLVRKLAMAEKRRARVAKQAEKQAAHKETPKADEKAIEEKLEEIIEKL